MSADESSNVVPFSRNPGMQQGPRATPAAGALSDLQKDCRAAMAHVNEAVELLQREVDDLVKRLSASPDAAEGDFALKRLEAVRAQLEATRLRSLEHTD